MAVKFKPAWKSRLVGKIPFKKKPGSLPILAVAFVVVVAGVTTGWFLSGISEKTGGQENGIVAPGAESGPKEAGFADEETFRDTAEGTLEKGGVDGEGTHHLVREGGETKYVYLTSTVIDLESFTGKNVEVWGETISAVVAPWLMDVGRIKVLD